MNYIALLRGINVAGNAKIEMKRLKQVFETADLTDVRTYINSGNVLFSSPASDPDKLARKLETAFQAEFGFIVPTLVIPGEDFKAIAAIIPEAWQNNSDTKCDVLFLWKGLDSPAILGQLPLRQGIDEHTKYQKGALLWCVSRKDIGRSGMLKLVGTPLYKQMTIRNCNTVRKLAAMLTN